MDYERKSEIYDHDRRRDVGAVKELGRSRFESSRVFDRELLRFLMPDVDPDAYLANVELCDGLRPSKILTNRDKRHQVLEGIRKNNPKNEVDIDTVSFFRVGDEQASV